MRIGIDLRFLLPGRVGGTEVFVRSLLAAMAQVACDHQFLVFNNPENAGSFGLERLPYFSETGNWDQSCRQQVLYFPGTTRIPLRSAVPSVVVVHDIQHVYYPQHFSLRERFRRWRRDRPSILQANEVISISKFTREALVEKYRLRPEKVVVVYPGVGGTFYRRISSDDLGRLRRKYSLPDAFIFYPARFWPHKNHANLYAAMKILQENRRQPIELVLCGETASRPLPPGVRSLGWVPFEDLPALYQAASALVFPSLHEGFGLPLLEAMASGCPVACAHLGALPEVGGQAAHYFDPDRPESIAAAIQEILGNESLRSSLVARGSTRAKSFTWEKTARRTIEVLAGHGQNGDE